jgi:hypothetical protein
MAMVKNTRNRCGINNPGSALYFASIVVAWLVLSAVVGFENMLDAGCFFMLVSRGILVVVDLAGQGQRSGSTTKAAFSYAGPSDPSNRGVSASLAGRTTAR